MLFAVWQELREEGGGKKNVQKCPGRTTVPHPAASPPPPPPNLLSLAEPRRVQNRTARSGWKGIAPGL